MASAFSRHLGLATRIPCTGGFVQKATCTERPPNSALLHSWSPAQATIYANFFPSQSSNTANSHFQFLSQKTNNTSKFLKRSSFLESARSVPHLSEKYWIPYRDLQGQVYDFSRVWPSDERLASLTAVCCTKGGRKCEVYSSMNYLPYDPGGGGGGGGLYNGKAMLKQVYSKWK